MNYEKKYKNALERASKLIVQNPFDTVSQMMEYVFPELAGDKDEMIRKELINTINLSYDCGIAITKEQHDKYITWLEKQGMSYTKRDVDDAYLKGMNDAKREIKKQYEATYQTRKDIATFIFNYRGDIKDRAKWMNFLGVKAYFFEKEDEKKLCDKCRKEQGSHSCQDITALGRCAVKHEKNPTDKVEPKFKVGDWITNKGHSYLIASIDYEQGRYLFEIGGYTHEQLNWEYIYSADEKYHLWTIADAKPGDVLASNNGVIILVKESRNSSWGYRLSYYCAVLYDGTFEPREFHVNPEKFFPATKEQRDLLFQKMEEAGYEWDANKKELKKIITEPKFKVGDWIIHRGTENVYQVVAYIDKQYQLKYGDNYTIQKCDEVDRNARLWTIQDARDGDVLAAHECYVIFKEIDGLNIKCYCTHHYMNNPSFHVDTLHNKDAFHPATKEQRDTLFAKMREAGYEWNAEKKEIKRQK